MSEKKSQALPDAIFGKRVIPNNTCLKNRGCIAASQGFFFKMQILTNVFNGVRRDMARVNGVCLRTTRQPSIVVKIGLLKTFLFTTTPTCIKIFHLVHDFKM